MDNVQCMIMETGYGKGLNGDVAQRWAAEILTARLSKRASGPLTKTTFHRRTNSRWPTATNKVKLPGIKPQRDLLKAALGNYWHRHKVARSQA